MKIKLLAMLLLIATLDVFAQNKEYYISTNGDDNNDGLNINTPWKTISKVNSSTFQPGDVISFKGGEIFDGLLKINSNHSGDSSKAVIFKSYGENRAIINGRTADGIWVYNAEFVEIRDLIVQGNGVNNNNGVGIYVTTSLNDKMLEGVHIDNVDVSGFYWSGITVSTSGNITKGFLNLRITNSAIHNNGMSGIESYGTWDDISGTSSFNHIGMYIGYTKVFENHGISTYTDNWSGTGILMAGVENGLIEYCEAYNNGKNNGCNTGGPVGIWLANAKNCIIQYCESYKNKAGKSKDGGGFDIDGGSQGCIIQYCYSHDNEGPGYALFEWGNNIPFTGNVIRYNISQNDARKNSYGAITFWASDADHKLLNCEVYNNSVYLSKENLVDGTPNAVKFINLQIKGLKIRNNIFYTTEGTRMLYSDNKFDTTIAHFQNNNFFDTSGKPNFYYRYNYSSFVDWKRAANGQEMRGNKSLGKTMDPRFINPGGGKTMNVASGGNLIYLTAYMLNPSSEMIDQGINLKQVFGLNVGKSDFYQQNFSDTTTFDIGANEYNAKMFTIMPLQIVMLGAYHERDHVAVEWRSNSNQKFEYFELEISSNGKDFKTVKRIKSFMTNSSDVIKDQIDIKPNGIVFLRIKGIQPNHNYNYSTIIMLNKKEAANTIKLFPNPVSDQLFIDTHKEKYQKLIIRSLTSQVVIVKRLNNETITSINIKELASGFYTLELHNMERNISRTLSFIKK